MRYRAFFTIVVLLLVMVWATGCRGEPTEVPPGDELSVARERSAEAGELKEAVMTPLPPTATAGVTPPPEAEQVLRLAVEDLAQRLDLVASEAIQLVSVEAVEWPDTSLGCPQPGMMYAQVITPGFHLVLEAAGQEYEYHTNQADYVVLCQPEAGGQKAATPASPSGVRGVEPVAIPELPAGAEDAVRLAMEDLARRLGLTREAIQLVSAEAVEWSDASLGCPQPGMMYAQVITPGFRVLLAARGQGYEYHTDEGRFVVLCEEDAGSGVVPSKG
jgi:hypothetical protein